MFKWLGGLVDSNEKELKRLQPLVSRINSLEPEFEKLTDAELRAKTDEFRARLEDGESLDELLPHAYAAVREAAKRTIEQRHFDVQLMGGIVLHQGKIAEMATGEGKTLVATLPLYLNALTGQGCHLVTVNDYLARRDCHWMGPIYHALGISVAAITAMQTPDKPFPSYIYDPGLDSGDPKWKHLYPIPYPPNQPQKARRQAYEADITYGTNNEFGFDYLRDNMVLDLSQCVQRPLNYAIVDEVDNILIDEARTPLIISGAAEEATQKYYLFARLASQLKKDEDYTIDERTRAVHLTDDIGITKMEKMLSYHSIDVRVLDGNGKYTYQTVYYSISTTFGGTDDINIYFTGLNNYQVNKIYVPEVNLAWSSSVAPTETSIYINHTYYTTVTNSSIIIPLADGTYDIRAVAIVGSTNKSVAVTYLEVITENQPPVIVSADKLWIEKGSNETVSWLVTDLDPKNYTIYQNGSAIANGSWINNIPIEIATDNLALGTYNYTLEVNDVSGLKTTKTIIVVMYQKPVLSTPVDLTYMEGTTGQTITWDLVDDNPINYTILIDNQKKEFDYLTNATENISYILPTLTKGTYIVAITVIDEDNQLAEDTVTVTVMANTQATTNPTTTNPTTTNPTGTSEPTSKQTTQNNSLNTTNGFEVLMVILLAIGIIPLKRKKN